MITDHGSLVALTADLDINFVGSVARTVVMAQVSNPAGGGGGGGGANPFVPSGDVVVPDENPFVPSGDVLSDGGSGGTAPQAPGGGGEVLGDRTEGGGGSSPGGGAGSGGTGGVVAAAPEEGGKLPFTGFAALAVGAIGATLTGTGVAIRAALRRRT